MLDINEVYIYFLIPKTHINSSEKLNSAFESKILYCHYNSDFPPLGYPNCTDQYRDGSSLYISETFLLKVPISSPTFIHTNSVYAVKAVQK